MTSFRFWAQVVFSLFTIALLFSLGTWQLQRLTWKEQLIASQETIWSKPCVDESLMDQFSNHPSETKDFYDRCVEVEGYFVESSDIKLTGKLAPAEDKELHKHLTMTKQSTYGIRSVSLFQTRGGHQLWIDRGWSPANSHAPHTQEDLGKIIKLTLMLRYPQKNPTLLNRFIPQNDLEKGQWVTLDTAHFSRFFQVSDALPYVGEIIEKKLVDQTVRFPRVRHIPLALRNQHLTYAFIWYSLCISFMTMLFFYHRSRKCSEGSNL